MAKGSFGRFTHIRTNLSQIPSVPYHDDTVIQASLLSLTRPGSHHSARHHEPERLEHRGRAGRTVEQTKTYRRCSSVADLSLGFLGFQTLPLVLRLTAAADSDGDLGVALRAEVDPQRDHRQPLHLRLLL